MPATEQTWRDMKLMHVVFGVSSVIMLLSTIWLLAKDHNREWKQYARMNRAIDEFTIQSQLSEEETDAYVAEHERLLRLRAAARNDVPDEQEIERFAAIALGDEQADAAERAGLRGPYNALAPAVRDALQARENADRLENEVLDARAQVQTAAEADQAAATALLRAAGDARAEAEQAAEQARQAARQTQERLTALESEFAEAQRAAAEAESRVADLRRDLFDQMRGRIADVRFEEDTLSGQRRFRSADLDAEKSRFDIAVRDNLPEETREAVRDNIDRVAAELAELTERFERAKDRRDRLEAMLRGMTEEEEFAERALQEHAGTLDRLRSALAERQLTWRDGKNLLTLPILDAFGGPLRIEQVWLPELTFDNNFRNIARFDRCITCHQGIDKTQPGSATIPAYVTLESNRPVLLSTPESAPAPPLAADGTPITDPDAVIERQLEEAYGLKLAARGLLAPNDVTVEVVWPKGRAARAGLERGDVLRRIRLGGQYETLLNREMAIRYLLHNVSWGSPIELQVDRGMPHPYSTHPRLDLFLGSMSPHPMPVMGCTICHDGQGSATEFKWASHMPDTPEQAKQWARDHGWFDNHHWIYPMQPMRFVESSCLKCHHEVESLEPSIRFPEPPAPKVVSGYNNVERFGCFGCHEINGYAGPDQRQGPDLRLEPSYYAAAQQLRHLLPERFDLLGQLSEEPDPEIARLLSDLSSMNELAETLEYHPEKSAPRTRLVDLLQRDERRAAAPGLLLADPGLVGEGRRLARQLRDNPLDFETRSRLVEIVRSDAESNRPLLSGESRDLLPFLVAPAGLSDEAIALAELFEDIETPGTRRKVGPSLRYVAGKLDRDMLIRWIADPTDIRPSTTMPKFFGLFDHLHDSPDSLAMSERFEPIEIRATAEYLLSRSQPFEMLQIPAEVTEAPDADRGKLQFQLRGCLACHAHEDVPGSEPADQGPNLTDLRTKLQTATGRDWLYSWLREPSRYHRRTLMPDTYLLPEPVLAADGTVERSDEGAPRMFDPAADIALYLVGDDLPESGPSVAPLSEAESRALRELTEVYLQGAFTRQEAARYAEQGIPEGLRDQVLGSERELLGEIGDEHRLQYVGSRTITRLGCTACHDVPGFESAKPIGAALADWGRKDTAMLAFEHIAEYLGHKHGHGDDPHPDPADFDPDTGYFIKALLSHSREGFLWQKLHEPRSYDFQKTDFKGYTERLVMPKFPLSEREVEEVMTFVLGLVAEPPAPQYIYNPEPRQQAIVEGRRVLNKYNCGGCHSLETDRWMIDYLPGDFPTFSPPFDFDFLHRDVSPQRIAASLETDRRGFLHAELRGYPVRSHRDGELEIVDEDGVVLTADELDDPTIEKFYKFQLWEPALLEGVERTVGAGDLLVPIARAGEVPQPRSGHLANLIFPLAVAEELQRNPNANPGEAWGWLPPSLHGQGAKTQTDWLHRFLLEPHPIRPSVVLRMPKFNMSSEEAAALANYFAALDNADYPYEFNPRQDPGYLARKAREHSNRLDDAMNIVANSCIQCHSIGDFHPDGSPAGLAPNLADIHNRFRPDYLRQWIANPKRLLPSTPMPVNIAPDVPLAQHWYPGGSVDQVDGVVDLLMNYHRYLDERTSVAEIVEGKVEAIEEEAAEAVDTSLE